jgi:rsbT antagonist protein RsbS
MKSGVPLQLHKQCLIASIQVDLSETILKQFQAELLDRIVEDIDIKGVVLDLSGLKIIDLPDFEALMKITHMVKLVGFNTVFLGLRPEVVSSLIMLDAQVDNLVGVASLDEALERLEHVDDAPEPSI